MTHPAQNQPNEGGEEWEVTIEDVERCSFGSWYEDFKDVTFKSVVAIKTRLTAERACGRSARSGITSNTDLRGGNVTI